MHSHLPHFTLDQQTDLDVKLFVSVLKRTLFCLSYRPSRGFFATQGQGYYSVEFFASCAMTPPVGYTAQVRRRGQPQPTTEAQVGKIQYVSCLYFEQSDDNHSLFRDRAVLLWKLRWDKHYNKSLDHFWEQLNILPKLLLRGFFLNGMVNEKAVMEFTGINANTNTIRNCSL